MTMLRSAAIGSFLRALLAHAVHPALETLQTIGVAAVQMLAQTDFFGGGVHRHFALGGVVAEFFQRGRADFPARHVDDPQEGVVVRRGSPAGGSRPSGL
ncbi:hypothetical protein CU663_15010 [Pseudomonas syringae pv. actinidifoliorum]|nr:hypothetical protein [Pseudomonas syringae pv. actinidifoliorum]